MSNKIPPPKKYLPTGKEYIIVPDDQCEFMIAHDFDKAKKINAIEAELSAAIVAERDKAKAEAEAEAEASSSTTTMARRSAKANAKAKAKAETDNHFTIYQ